MLCNDENALYRCRILRSFIDFFENKGVVSRRSSPEQQLLSNGRCKKNPNERLVAIHPVSDLAVGNDRIDLNREQDRIGNYRCTDIHAVGNDNPVLIILI